MTATQMPGPTRRQRLFGNPVLRRELLERWRGRRAFTVIVVELLLLSAILLLLYWAGRSILLDQLRFGGNVTDSGPLLGRFLLDNTFAFALLFVLFIGPGYAAAQIAGERERQTLGLLQITLVGPWGIVLGKLAAASAWLVLLAIVTIPLGAAGFVLGGAVWTDLIRGFVYVVLIAVSVAAMGIGISSLVRRTTAAVVLTYGMVLFLVVGTLFMTGIEAVARSDRFGGNLESGRLWSLTLNPYLGLADALQSTVTSDLPTPLTPFALALPTNQEQFFGGGFGQEVLVDDVFVEEVPFAGGFPNDRAVPLDRLAQQDVIDALGRDEGREPVWLETAGIFVLFGVGWLAIAARRVRGEPPGRRRRPGRGERVIGPAPSSPAPVTAPAGPPPPSAGG